MAHKDLPEGTPGRPAADEPLGWKVGRPIRTAHPEGILDRPVAALPESPTKEHLAMARKDRREDNTAR